MELLFPLFTAVVEGFCLNTFQLTCYALLDISQSTKFAPFFKWFLSRRNENKPQGLRSGKEGAEKQQECFDGYCRVTWGVVVVQHPSACNAWSHMCHPFPEYFKDFPIISLIDSLSWWHKFLVDNPLTVEKTNKHRFSFGFAHSCFLGTGRVWSVPLPTLFCVGVILQNSWFITCDNMTEESWLPLKAVQNIKTHIPPIGLLLSCEVLWNDLGTHFSCPNPVLKFDGW